MKRIVITILTLLITTTVLAVDKKSGEVKDKKSGEVKEKSSAKVNLPNGYGGISWGTPLSKVKGEIAGKLKYTDNKTVIISYDGDLEYRYGFFYAVPMEKVSDKKDTSKDAKGKEGEPAGEGKLFYVSLKFPYLLLSDLIKKLEEKYGPNTGENLVKNQGSISWSSEKTDIVVWIDNYKDNAYCRRITYVSNEFKGQLNQFQKDLFKKGQLDMIEKLEKTLKK